LIPADTGLSQARALVKDPNRDPLPSDQELANQIKLGYQTMVDTPGQAGKYTGNELSCTNCHLNAGQKDKSLPLTVSRSISRSTALVKDGSSRWKTGFVVASCEGKTAPCLPTIARNRWRSRRTSPGYRTGKPVGQTPPWVHQNTIAKENVLPQDKLDPGQGKQLYDQECAACHGPDGQGLQLAQVKPGPLWGPKSWNDGAGLARVQTLAGFIRYAMPLSAPGSLTDEQAQQTVAFIDSQPRPHFEQQPSNTC
jgi:thiosulfate dehydrogenase